MKQKPPASVGATLGYEVVGVDNDPAVSPSILADLRDLDSLASDFDAVINMWASFGYFDPGTNERVLASFSRRLRPGGRLVLDVFNRSFFEAQEHEHEVERELRPGIVERSILIGDRRQCELHYGDGHVDRFEWQLYHPEELELLGAAHGLVPVLRIAPNDVSAMQLVLQRDA
jgi:SAM-dependent methyltransferase